MNSPIIQQIQFKPGDRVLHHIVKDESNETILSAVVLEIDAHDPLVVRVKFDVPHAEGNLDDWVDAVSLTSAEDEDKDIAAVEPSKPVEVSEHPAIKQLRALYPNKADRIAVTRIHSTKKDANGRPISKTDVVSVKSLVSEKSIARLQALNGEGWNVYFSMNSIQLGADRRKKEFAGEPAHVFMEVDEGGDSTLDSVRTLAAAKVIPAPTIIVRSSEAKYQFVWNVDASDFTFEKIEALNAGLVRRFGSDPACTDCLRVFRAAGFKNLKYESQPVVEIIEMNEAEQRHKLADFHIEVGEGEGDGPAKPAAGEEDLQKIINYVEDAVEKAKAKGTDLNLCPLEKWGDKGFLLKCTCLWVSEHTKQVDSGTAIVIMKSGAIVYRCPHTNCIDKTWPIDARPKLEAIVGESLRFGDPVGGATVGGSRRDTPTNSTPPDIQAWGEPQSFDNSLLPVQPFKLEFLPSSLQPWAKDVSERMGVPLDFPGISMLCALAGCINRRAFVYPKAFDKEWREAIAISGSVIATSGKLKTPTWKTSVNPMMEIDIDWQNEYKARLATYKSERKVFEEEQKLIKKEFSKLRKKDQSDAGPVFASTAVPPPKIAAPPIDIEPCRRLVLNDATPESFHDIMADNPEGLFVYRDEMTGWVAELDQKDRESERSLFLKAMNDDDPYTLDRIGRGTVSARVSASLFGGFQPEPLVRFLCDSRNTTDGMLARFWLLVWPDDTLSSPPIDRVANSGAKDMFRTVIRRLANLRAESVFLHFSPDAQAKFNDWLINHVLKTDKEANAAKQSHLSKYRGLLPKLAGLFQLVDMASTIPDFDRDHLIDLDHLNRAIALLSYLESHMNRIYACVKSLEQKAVEALAQHVKAGDLKDGFSIRDVQRKGWESLSKNYVEDAILTLEELGWLRLAASKEDLGRGRPTYRWEINPKLKKPEVNQIAKIAA